MKPFFTLVTILFCVSVFSQKVSDYQYVIVPKQFQFQKSINQYQINGLSKFLFEKYNFTTFWDDNLPYEVTNNLCNVLKADVKSNSNMFVTKVVLTLTDCKGNVVFTSREGKSREKDFKKAYDEAIREAFEDVKNLNYKYVGSSQEKKVETQKDEQAIYKTEKHVTVENQISPTFKQPLPEGHKNSLAKYPILYAQPTENGFQLVDNTPKVVLKLQNTSRNELFIASKPDGTIGLFYLKAGTYVFEFFQNGKQQEEFYNVKF